MTARQTHSLPSESMYLIKNEILIVKEKTIQLYKMNLKMEKSIQLEQFKSASQVVTASRTHPLSSEWIELIQLNRIKTVQ